VNVTGGVYLCRIVRFGTFVTNSRHYNNENYFVIHVFILVEHDKMQEPETARHLLAITLDKRNTKRTLEYHMTYIHEQDNNKHNKRVRLQSISVTLNPRSCLPSLLAFSPVPWCTVHTCKQAQSKRFGLTFNAQTHNSCSILCQPRRLVHNSTGRSLDSRT